MKSTFALGFVAALVAALWVFLWAPWEPESNWQELDAGAIAEELYLPGTIAHGPLNEDFVALDRDLNLQLPVQVKAADGWQIPDARIGFAFAAPKHSGAPDQVVRTDGNGQALFEFEASDFVGRELEMCTVALMVPSNPPQVQEVRADRLALTPVHFTRPVTGQLTVIVTHADGRPVKDGTRVFLQLAGSDFRPQLGKCVTTAWLNNGEAEFNYVGVNTKLTVAVQNNAMEGGYSTMDIRGPSFENQEIYAELILAGPIPTVQLHATGEGGVAAMNESLSGRVSYRLAPQYVREFGFSAELDKEGVAEVQFPRDLAQASQALLATQVRSKTNPDAAELRIGLRALYHRTLKGQFQKWTVHHGKDVIVSGKIIDQFGDPYAHCELRFSVMMGNISGGSPLLAWNFTTDAHGNFQVYAPVLAGLSYRLDRQLGKFGRMEIEFTPGLADQEFKVVANPQFLGRILVDDPTFISELSFDSLIHLAKEDRENFMRRILKDDGTFRYRGRAGGKTRPSLYCTTTGERLDAHLYMDGNPVREGNLYRFPDWNLRGKLFQHQLNVHNEDGGSAGEITYRFPGIADGRLIVAKGPLSFLSGDAQVPVFINAEGYREQKVMSNGKADVFLRKGIPLQVSFDPPLPIEDGVQWRILVKERLSSLQPEQLKWQKVFGRVAQLSLPSNGTWDVYLRASPSRVDSEYGWSDTSLDGILDEDGKAIKVYNADLEITLSFSNKQYAEAIAWIREFEPEAAQRLPRD